MEQLRRAAASAVSKINIDSDGRLAMTARIPSDAKDPPISSAQVPGSGAYGAHKMIKQKNTSVLGSSGKA